MHACDEMHVCLCFSMKTMNLTLGMTIVFLRMRRMACEGAHRGITAIAGHLVLEFRMSL